MSTIPESDAARYRRLIDLHHADPLGGLNDADLQWLIAYEEAHPEDELVFRVRKQGANFEKWLLNQAPVASSTPQMPTQDTVRQLNKLKPRLKEEFGIELTSKKFWRFLPAIAASFLAVLTFTYFLLRSPENYPTGSPEDYQPYAYLENEISSRQRAGGDIKIQIELPKPENNFQASQSSENVKIRFKGTILGDITDPQSRFTLAVLSNKAEDYVNENYLWQDILSSVLDEPGYHFDQTAEIPFAPGLYYFLLFDLEINDHLLVGKFYINRK